MRRLDVPLTAPRWDASGHPANDQRAHLGDALVVTVDVHDTELVVERGAGNQESRNRRAVPHAVVVSEVALPVDPPYEATRTSTRWGARPP